ncbi:Trypsin [Popillia japonica]|uniref:Trypsin n=1 Tax=Popillia japonica TaxID=7064 RepID=A0AAW1HX38_POPJA
MIHPLVLYSAIIPNIVGAKIGNASKRVIGGSLANIAKYPFYTYIAYYPSNSILCGGTIIEPDLILTAAHCLAEEDFKVYVRISNINNLREAEAY